MLIQKKMYKTLLKLEDCKQNIILIRRFLFDWLIIKSIPQIWHERTELYLVFVIFVVVASAVRNSDQTAKQKYQKCSQSFVGILNL